MPRKRDSGADHSLTAHSPADNSPAAHSPADEGTASADQARARAEQAARERLQELAGADLPTPPWRPAPVPPSATDLAHFALFQFTQSQSTQSQSSRAQSSRAQSSRAQSSRAQSSQARGADLSTEDLCDALALLPAARDEVDGLEAGLLFTARSAGLTWAQIATAMGFNSPQACQQHFNRLTARGSDPA